MRWAPLTAADIVHGNLKPSNVFITTDGHVKLLELGAAGGRPRRRPLRSRAPTAPRARPSMQVPPVAPAPAGEFFHRLPGAGTDRRSGRAITAPTSLRRRPALRDGHGPACVPGRHARPKIAAAIGVHEPPDPRAVNPQFRPPSRRSSLGRSRKDPIEALPVGCGAARGSARARARPSTCRCRLFPRWRFSRRVVTARRGWRRCADRSRRARSRRRCAPAGGQAAAVSSAARCCVSQIANGTGIPTSTARCAKPSRSTWHSRHISISSPTSGSAARCS